MRQDGEAKEEEIENCSVLCSSNIEETTAEMSKAFRFCSYSFVSAISDN